MGLQFYKPNSKNAGAACGVSFNSKDEAIYLSFIKQTSWNEKEKTGSFKGGEKCNVKFSLFETGSMIAVITQALSPVYEIASQGAVSKSDDLLEDAPEQSDGLSLISSGKPSEFQAFHTGANQITKIKFAPYYKEKGAKKILSGIGLSVSKEDTKDSSKKVGYSLGFSLGEATTLKQYLEFGLEHCFTAIYSADKKAALDRKAQEESATGKTEDEL